MSSKVYLLEPANLDQVDSQLGTLQTKLSQVAERRVQLDEAHNTDRVNQMYEVVKRCDTLMPSLESVVQSLSALQDLHEQG